MKNFVLAAFASLATAAVVAPQAHAQTACPASTNVVTVAAQTITTATTWTRGNIYLLTGFVYVDNGATLTIESGTIIKGDLAGKGSLVIRQGAKLIAAGTATQPIVFTSNQPAGSRAPRRSSPPSSTEPASPSTSAAPRDCSAPRSARPC